MAESTSQPQTGGYLRIEGKLADQRDQPCGHQQRAGLGCGQWQPRAEDRALRRESGPVGFGTEVPFLLPHLAPGRPWPVLSSLPQAEKALAGAGGVSITNSSAVSSLHLSSLFLCSFSLSLYPKH